ncbi:MAG: single-stranded DNA-binding protein [Enterobacteriaceae bacterium]
MSARGVNRVTLLGFLGQDPEIRYLPNDGGAIATLSLATSEVWKDKQTGEQKDRTDWHRVVVFGKLAEIVGEYMRKGSQVYLEGQLRTRKWFDQQNGMDRYTTEVIVARNGVIQMTGSRPDGSQKKANGSTRNAAVSASEATASPPTTVTNYAPPADWDDDIPF